MKKYTVLLLLCILFACLQVRSLGGVVIVFVPTIFIFLNFIYQKIKYGNVDRERLHKPMQIFLTVLLILLAVGFLNTLGL